MSAAVLLTFTAQATDSLIDLETSEHAFLPEKTPDENLLTLWERFDSSFSIRAETEFSDTFHPFNMITRSNV